MTCFLFSSRFNVRHDQGTFDVLKDSRMKAKDLLLWIQKPARIELRGRLPDFLENGARGGFHPCGMWDFIIDSRRLVWCGMQFYLASHSAESIECSNPGMDKSVIHIKRVDEIYKDQNSLDTCAQNGTSHVLQIVWSETQEVEVVPAMDYSDSWYAKVAEENFVPQDRFSTSHQFCAIGIFEFESKLHQAGIEFPRTFVCPFVDRSV
jgi:hypothetical protein